MGKLIKRIPGLRILISSLPGSALRTHVESFESLAMSTSVLKDLPGKYNIKRHSTCILYISASVLKALHGKHDIKRHSPIFLFISIGLALSTSLLKALPGKLYIKRHSPSILYFS